VPKSIFIKGSLCGLTNDEWLAGTVLFFCLKMKKPLPQQERLEARLLAGGKKGLLRIIFSGFMPIKNRRGKNYAGE